MAVGKVRGTHHDARRRARCDAALSAATKEHTRSTVRSTYCHSHRRMLTHRNLLANARHMVGAFGYRQDDIYPHAARMFDLGDGSSTYPVTWTGGRHGMIPAFDPELWLRTTATERVTRGALVPTMINMLVSHLALAEHTVSSIRGMFYRGSAMPEELLRRAMTCFPCDWLQAYSMTEPAPIVSFLAPTDHRRGVKDMIISGGENVYSTEVENAIYQHPAVLEAAVFGIPDEQSGERVHAAIVLKPNATATVDEIAARCRKLIAGYKLPRSIQLHGQPLPKSGAVKTLKRRLREPYWRGCRQLTKLRPQADQHALANHEEAGVRPRLQQPRSHLVQLTKRERQVLDLLAQGLTDRGIGETLWLTSKTVQTHVRHILAKLNLPTDTRHNRRVLAVLTYLEGGEPADSRGQ
jgi:DNA-binding NarL/FixJ family response regulator